MARLTKEEWQKVRIEYEIKGMSHAELAEKYHLPRSTVAYQSSTKGWIKGKAENAVQKKAQIYRDLKAIEKETEHFTAWEKAALDIEARSRAKMQLFFEDSAIKNQKAANSMLMKQVEEGNICGIESHARITARNRETVLGKTPETQVNVQQNAAQTSTIDLSKLTLEELETIQGLIEKAEQ